MRFEGILSSWDEANGSGIIEPDKRGDKIAVHLSAFPPDGRRPVQGEPVSFSIELDADGHKRACKVARPQPARSVSRAAANHARAKSQSTLITAALVAVSAVMALSYSTIRKAGDVETILAPVAVSQPGTDETRSRPRRTDMVAATRFARPAPAKCDGRTRCSQMTSCDEAKFFVQNCPGVAMDGDRDGIPCESQWCAGGS